MADGRRIDPPGLLYGLSLPFLSAKLIASDRRVLGLALLPFLLGIGLSAWLGTAIHDQMTAQATALLGRFGFEASGLLGTILSWVAGILSFFGMALLLPFVNALAAVPVNDFLAEATETRADPPLPAAPSPNMGQRLALIWMDLAKTAIALVITIPLLLLSFIPGLALVCFPVMWLMFAFQTLSYPQTRRAEGVGAAFGFVKTYLGACLGFGLVHGALGILPFVSAVVPPLAVVGGTLLYARAVGSRARSCGPVDK